MNKGKILIGTLFAGLQFVHAQVALYTNAPAGSGVLLSQDVEVDNPLTNTADAAGIFFSGSPGTLTGTGDFTVRNTSTTNGIGTDYLVGVQVATLTNTYTGTLTVINDQSAYDGAGDQGEAYARGIEGNVIGGVGGDIKVTTISGAENKRSASAGATAINGSVSGDVRGTLESYAQGGFATGAGLFAGGYAIGVYGSVSGNVSGNISVEGRAGTVVGTESASARAYASGVQNEISGDVSGRISVSGTGGYAISTNGYAEARSDTHGVEWSVAGELSGILSAEGLGGYAVSSNSYAAAEASVFGVDQSVDGGISGLISVRAQGGWAYGVTNDVLEYGTFKVTNNVSADASAEAYGVAFGMDLAEVSGQIEVFAAGGRAEGLLDADASAKAYGISGDSVTISNFNGTIRAMAVPGLEIFGGTTNSGLVQAVGISADSQLYLNASNGTIQTFIDVPNGFSEMDLPAGSTATAIQGGSAADTVLLNRMSLIGDIDLNGGINTLTILGDTEIDGDIYADDGALVFHVERGILGFTDTAGIRDLQGALNVSSNAGLGVVLKAGVTNAPALTIDGTLNVEEGARLSAAPEAGASADGFIGQTFEAIAASNITGAAFVDAGTSLFAIEITNTASSVYVMPTALRYQDSPAPGAMAASISSLKAVMQSLSTRMSGSRRRLADSAHRPAGAGGPDSGPEWELYVRQFNDIGGLESDGARSGYDWSTHGFSVGAEKTAGEDLLFGVTASGAWTDLDGERNAGDGDAEMLILSAYGTCVKDQGYTELGMGFGQSWNEARRTDTIGDRYEGEYDSSLIGMWFEAGYVYDLNENFKLEPYGRVNYIHGEHDGYTESGTPAPMTVSGSSSDNLPTELGLRGTRAWGAHFRLALSAGWSHEWLDRNISVNTRVLGIQQQVATPDADRDALVLGCNGEWAVNDQWSVGLEYKPTFSGNWQNHAVNGHLSCRF
ncbi:autotransporter domain-containing protein [Pontiella sp.]|uniref:autotransporter family protein n=1 Tax=Pontiella sp. TaxID=2837462 RepID=UPI0035691F42